MKRSSTTFLKEVILLITIGTIAGMIRFPQLEGRAANLTLISIYTDPFIIYIYLSSIPFFVGLYHAFKLLNLIDTNKAFSQSAINSLKNIKFAFLCFVGFIAIALFYIRFFVHDDDPAGPTALGIVISFASIIIATAAAVFQKLLQNAVDINQKMI